jgi:hypothetical protein
MTRHILRWRITAKHYFVLILNNPQIPLRFEEILQLKQMSTLDFEKFTEWPKSQC